MDGPESACASRVLASPNHGERLGTDRPSCILLHYTGMADGASAIAWLREPRAQVSSHYVVEEDGTIVQLVPERRRAWHAGRSVWQGDTDINSASIGIEIVNGGHDFGLPPFPDRQIDSVICLCRDIVTRWSMDPRRILAHSDVAPGRKADPGERFPWQRLAAGGLGLWPEPAALAAAPAGDPLAAAACGPEVRRLQADLASFGYGLEADGCYGERTVAVIEAFQRHFRPARIDGVADGETRRILAALIATTR